MFDVITKETKVGEIQRIFDSRELNYGRGLDISSIVVLQGLFQQGDHIVVEGFGEFATLHPMSAEEYEKFVESEEAK